MQQAARQGASEGELAAASAIQEYIAIAWRTAEQVLRDKVRDSPTSDGRGRFAITVQLHPLQRREQRRSSQFSAMAYSAARFCVSAAAALS
jgi:hypothetical protein